MLFGSRPLHAEDLGPTLLSYRAPAGCPTVADFQNSVQRRSARVRFVEAGAHDRHLSIVMRKDGEFMRGELRLSERDGSLRQRNVRFTTCSEAVEGLALIAVVSLDPQALLEPDQPQQPARVTPQPVHAPPNSEKRDSSAGTRQSKTRLAVGGEFTVAPRALPATAFGGALFVDLASDAES
ncbi:MAG TPA: hypothetical protein VGC79_03025, partial [Polyangiaceae bacterium]